MTTTLDTPTAPATPSTPALSGEYTIDASHTRLGFSARHAMVTKVRGSFTDFTGTATINEADPAASRVEIVIATSSITTGNTDRDAHLSSGDFFDAATHPEIRFTSTAVRRDPSDPSQWTIAGDLNIKGAARPVSIEFTHTGAAQDPFGNDRIGFEGETTINRKDWDLTWNAALETGGVLVSDKIKLEFDISAIRNA